MTAEVDVDVHGEVSEVSKVEFEEKRSNGIMVNGNNKDDADGSYVFVTGNEGVSDDPVNASPNKEIGNNGYGGGGEINGAEEPGEEIKVESSEDAEEEKSQALVSEVVECVPQSTRVEVDDVKVDDDRLLSTGEVEEIKESPILIANSAGDSESHRVDDGDEKIEEESQSDLGIHGNDNREVQFELDQEREQAELANEVPVTDTELELETEVANGPVSDENGDASTMDHDQDTLSGTVHANQNVAEQNGFSENGESLPPQVVCENAAVNEIPVEAELGEREVALEQSSKAASCQVTDAQLETEVVGNGTVSDQNGDCFPTDHPQDSISDSVIGDGLPGNSQNTPEQNVSSEREVALEQSSKAASCQVTDALLETEVVSNGPISDQNGDCLPTDHPQDSISVNVVGDDLPGESQIYTPEQNVSSEREVALEQSSKAASCQVTDALLETEVVSNGPISDQNGDCLPTDHPQDSISVNVVGDDLPGESQIYTPEQNVSSEREVALEQSSKAASCQVTDAQLETEVVGNGPVSDQNGDCLPTDHPQDSISDNVIIGDDLPGDGQIYTPEQNVSSEREVALEQSSKAASCQVTDAQLETEVVSNGPVSDQNGDYLPTDHPQNSISDNVIIGDDLPGDSQIYTPEQNVSSEREVALEQSSKAASCQVTDVQLETEVVSNGPVSDQNGDSLPTDHPQDCISDSVIDDDLPGDSQNTPEQNVSSENVECLPSPVVCGNVPIKSDGSFPTAPENGTVVEEDAGNGASLITETCAADRESSETEVGQLDANRSESPDSCPVDDTNDDIKLEIEVENVPDDAMSSFRDDARSETETGYVAIECEEKVSDIPSDAGKIESEAPITVTDSAGDQPISVATTDMESHVNCLVENESNISTSPGAGVKSESEVDTSATSSWGVPCNGGIESEPKVLDGSAIGSEIAQNCVPAVVLVEDDLPTGVDSDGKPTSEEAEGIAEIHGNETSTTAAEGSTVDALEGQNANTEVVKRPFNFFIRHPRYDDENLREQIQHAQIQVDEKTKSRDAIRGEIQMKKVPWKEHSDNFEAAVSEERASRDLLRSKRQEIDSALSVINKVKNAMSVEDIDGRIRNMEHMIEHETLPLKEEKQLIREIKQLKQHREQLSSNMGRQDDIQQALDQKDQIEEQLKILRKEADLLREKFLKAEAVTKAAKKKYIDENVKLNELQARFKAADDIRQEAYAHLQSLRKTLHEKNKHFWRYKDDFKAATDLASKGDKEELQRLCVNQVEKFMELWNKNDEFRKEYVRCNTRSTLRRLRTLDGRSLGPDEEPPVIPNLIYERAAKENSASLLSSMEQKKQIVQVEKQIIQAEAEKVKHNKPTAKVVEQKNQTANSKKPAKPAPLGNGLATVSGRDEIEVAREEEEHKRKKEEEELRKEEEAAKLREQRKLEEKAKSKEALERKKRNADKAQARALLRAQKEAEQKEKEKEKKAKKKEKKKVGAVESADGADEGESAPNSEIPTETLKEPETREKAVTITKRPQKPTQFTKAKSIPLPLRNRGKRRMQPWMWVLLFALIVFGLFLVGNSSFSFNLGLQRFGF